MTGARHGRGRAAMPAISAALLLLLPSSTMAQTSVHPGLAGDPLTRSISEASQRFGLPEPWIRAVIRAESDFDPRATSRVGAMGLMQVMPATYAQLRTRYGLGPDAYAPRDNVLAGTAYLRELYDRFGSSGFLAAYNAGPGRYQEHLQTGRILPLETRVYVARIAAKLVGNAPERAPNDSSTSLRRVSPVWIGVEKGPR
ncbi:hypothetical protein BH10PSE1_BH10PSE1_35250 [soil metagenome]